MQFHYSMEMSIMGIKTMKFINGNVRIVIKNLNQNYIIINMFLKKFLILFQYVHIVFHLVIYDHK